MKVIVRVATCHCSFMYGARRFGAHFTTFGGTLYRHLKRNVEVWPHGSDDVAAGEGGVVGVDYHGNMVDENTAAVLYHVLDGFNDHLGRRDLPTLTFKLGAFTDLGDDPKHKAVDDGPGNKYNAPVSVVYNIDGRDVASGYFAVDNMLFEMQVIME